MSHKNIQLEVVSTDSPTVGYRNVNGYGENAQAVIIDGTIANLMVKFNGKDKLNIYIRDDGSLELHNMDDNWQYTTRSLSLTTTNPWK